MLESLWKAIELVAGRYHDHGRAWIIKATDKPTEDEEEEAAEEKKKISLKEKILTKVKELHAKARDKVLLMADSVKEMLCATEPGPEDGTDGASKKEQRGSVLTFYEEVRPTIDQSISLLIKQSSNQAITRELVHEEVQPTTDQSSNLLIKQ